MAEIRSRRSEIKEKIRKWDINDPIPGTTASVESRYKNIESAIRDGKYAITDPDFLIGAGISLGRRYLIKKRIEGKLEWMGALSNWWMKDDPTYESRQEDIEGRIKKESTETTDTTPAHIRLLRNTRGTKTITLINIDWEPVNDDPLNLVFIELPFIPRELHYKIETKLPSLNSPGRNNPFYHYGGSEDTLEFTIDWTFTDDQTRRKSLQNARWLEAMTKANGYNGYLPRLSIMWGDPYGPFEDHLFIVENASYDLSHFAAAGLTKRLGNDIIGEAFPLLPQTIRQDVTLKRVTTHNLTHKEIRKV